MNQLKFITSEKLYPFRHGFFERHDGVSDAVCDSFNFAFRTEDDTKNIFQNRVKVASCLRIKPQNLFFGHQVHSTEVAIIHDTVEDDCFKVDAAVTKSCSQGLGVMTADCQPILLADHKSGVVGAVHAGWRGTLNGIIENTVDAMIVEGASRSNIKAAIGPTISQKNYEVGEEFKDQFVQTDPESQQFFETTSHGRIAFDLPHYGLIRLARAGITDAEWIGICTYEQSDRFFSYRRNFHEGKTNTGLMVSAIVA